MSHVESPPVRHQDPIQVEPLPGPLGARIGGIDLKTIGPREMQTLRKIWLDHMLLVFPGQELSPDDLVRFATLFGRPIASCDINQGKFKDPAYELDLLPPQITAVSNIKQGGQSIGVLGDAEVVWHCDHSYLEHPAAMRMLYGAEVPPVAAGGNTGFMNCCAAYDALPAPMKRRLSGLTIKHDNDISVTMEVREGAKLRDIVHSPGPSHPIISTHPETGHNSLFLGRRSRAYVNGMGLEDSEALLDELWAHCTQDRFCCEHEWSVGDLVLWDNRCTMHRRSSFDPQRRRLLLAAQVEGHRPCEAPDALARPAHPRFALAGRQ